MRKPRKPMLFPETFATRLASLLTEAKWSVYRLAKEAGLPVPTVRHYVRGQREPTFANAVKIARALGVSVEAFADTVPLPEEKP